MRWDNFSALPSWDDGVDVKRSKKSEVGSGEISWIIACHHGKGECMKSKKALGDISATRMVASTFGVLVGLAGIDHGIFETLQRNGGPGNLMIEAIGPAQRFWEYGTEPALTVIPSFLVTGILSIIVGLGVILWSVMFVDRKYGAGVLLLLSILLFLVGGGFAPIFLAILAVITATRINKPLAWWRRYIPVAIQAFLAWLWPGSLIAFVLVFIISVEIAIFGYPFVGLWGAEATMALLSSASNLMIGLMLLSPLTAFAYVTKSRTNGV